MHKKFLGDYEFIWGPVRKGVSESIFYDFLSSGEELHNLEITFGYKKRDAKNILALKNNLYEQVLVAERISGPHAFSASLSFCLSVEDFFGLKDKIHKNLQLLRMFFAEVERIRNHVENLSEIAESTYIQVPSAMYSYYAELLKQLSLKFFDSRYLMGINTVGGIRKNLSLNDIEFIFNSVRPIVSGVQEIIKKNMETKSHIDRLKTTGKIDMKTAKRFYAQGIVAKSAGINTDLRIKRPYLLYGDIKLNSIVFNDGDAFSRYMVRIKEIGQSLRVLDYCIEMLKKNRFNNASDYFTFRSDMDNPIDLSSKRENNKEKHGFGYAESSEGPIFCYIKDFDGRIFTKINLRYPFENNYKLFACGTKNTMMMDFNINETSYNFSVAAIDK
ncbi:MAG: NADH-quinone oxidoreductase subunit D-related protein [bacterium]